MFVLFFCFLLLYIYTLIPMKVSTQMMVPYVCVLCLSCVSHGSYAKLLTDAPKCLDVRVLFALCSLSRALRLLTPTPDLVFDISLPPLSIPLHRGLLGHGERGVLHPHRGGRPHHVHGLLRLHRRRLRDPMSAGTGENLVSDPRGS